VSHLRPTKPAPLSEAKPDARLPAPFDPQAESASFHRGKNSQTTRQKPHLGNPWTDHFASARRPYSEHFNGSGRLGWDTFLADYEKTPGSFPNEPVIQTDSDPIMRKENPETVSPAMPDLSTRPVEPIIDISETHEDVSSVSKVQECVEMLKTLGFGKEEDGGTNRLVIYAQAADGDLEAAMEMIEEERKAWEQRT